MGRSARGSWVCCRRHGRVRRGDLLRHAAPESMDVCATQRTGAVDPLLPLAIVRSQTALQRLLMSMTRTRAHGLHRIPVLAPQEFWRLERPVSGELLTYTGMSDVALRCQTVERLLLRRANLRNRPIAAHRHRAIMGSIAVAAGRGETSKSRCRTHCGR